LLHTYGASNAASTQRTLPGQHTARKRKIAPILWIRWDSGPHYVPAHCHAGVLDSTL